MLNKVHIRAERWVHEKYPNLTRRHIREATEAGWVRLKGSRVKKGVRLLGDDTLETDQLDRHLARIRQGNPQLSIQVVSQETNYVVVDKPAGVPSHPISLFDENTLTHWALAQFPQVHQEFSEIQPTVTPHRLDTGTSGVQIVALTQEAYLHWRGLFSTHQVTKSYLAWCWGAPLEKSFSVRLGLVHDPKDSRKMIPAPEDVQSVVQPAESSIEVIEARPDRFLAKVTCRTGVTHQVRVHLASCGFPLIGDKLYDTEFEKRTLKPAQQLLRAIELQTKENVFRVDDKAFYNLASDAS